MRSIRVSTAAALLLGLCCLPASAANFELYGGYFSPGDGFFDDGLTYGARASWPLRRDWMAEVSVGRWEDSRTERFGGIQFPGLPPIGGVTVDFDLTLTMIDLSVGKQLGFSGWRVFGGPGWGFAEADAQVRGFGLPGPIDVGTSATDRDDSFTYHVGVAGYFPLGEHFYLRPDLRGRWFDEGGSGDLEASVAVGWRP